MEEDLIGKIPEFVSAVLKISQPHVWIDYDSEADVLYISFQKPQQANDSKMLDDTIINYRDKKIVGITIMNASDYLKLG
ncbi:MAG: DUF2283 domain-containing protein [Candidatus Helarchaeota archaeon]|nr:DUF2283 domain-containing protein [Candidatus Helarchaeota archaeon]